MGKSRNPIVSLTVAAPGWRAVYRESRGLVTRELASWALVERDQGTSRDRQEMIGIVKYQGRNVFADQVGGVDCRFCGYAAPGTALEDFREPEISEAETMGYASSWFG
jgi:hypothetical protein